MTALRRTIATTIQALDSAAHAASRGDAGAATQAQALATVVAGWGAMGLTVSREAGWYILDAVGQGGAR